jgi:hypothetical protein
LGRQHTTAGQELPSTARRPFKELELRGFSLPTAKFFVDRYFRLKCREIKRDQPSDQWINKRLGEICSSDYDELITRPIRAQMMCDIALDPELSLKHITKYDLYDRFVHHLFSREVDKKARFSEINFTYLLLNCSNPALDDYVRFWIGQGEPA